MPHLVNGTDIIIRLATFQRVTSLHPDNIQNSRVFDPSIAFDGNLNDLFTFGTCIPCTEQLQHQNHN
jgi:hypothetical protein